ncbi:antibiotic biosynthesis monooxygenase [Pedobacter gandavensis]|uniref:putative quinol monooxygenase n=1 Tax=Pedobacter gandavensis TaxID=2679963 RepID=UPI002479E5C1|nr:antibiotic biosynthesis monooxygenase family protein [Pedobacter gandavensis]WGQ11348.1 antibiotic biosynthesis monooxygenase [Pedobacter gandavensis]
MLNITDVNAQNPLVNKTVKDSDMLVRISEIEVFPEYLESYNAILKEEAAASVKIEPGVIGIFPMSIKEQPNQVRIVEIYANRQAYQAHLETVHFKHYKTATLKMVKSLKLMDMDALDSKTMKLIFSKMK